MYFPLPFSYVLPFHSIIAVVLQGTVTSSVSSVFLTLIFPYSEINSLSQFPKTSSSIGATLNFEKPGSIAEMPQIFLKMKSSTTPKA